MDQQDRLAPAGKARLAAEVSWTYLHVRRVTRGVDLPTSLARLRAPLDGPARQPIELTAGLRLGRAVARTLRALPADSRCLMQSLVLTGMLARRGTPSTLVIGVKPGTSFAAHAWVEAGGQPLLPPLAEDFSRFVDL